MERDEKYIVENFESSITEKINENLDICIYDENITNDKDNNIVEENRAENIIRNISHEYLEQKYINNSSNNLNNDDKAIGDIINKLEQVQCNQEKSIQYFENDEIKNFTENIKNLEEKIHFLELEKLTYVQETMNKENLKEKVKNLEDKIIIYELEKVKVKEENEKFQSCLKSDFRLKVDHLMKNVEDAKKDKESMVLKFAQSEQKNMELLKKIKELEGRLREKTISVDQLISEKDKLNKELRSKVIDYSTYEKELNNLKASLTIAEQKLKNEDFKFKEEIEKNKEIKKKYEDLQKNILVMKEENCTLRTNCQEIVKTYQDSEDMRSNSLSSSIKQIKEDLKKCTEEKKEAIDNFNKINSDLQATKISVNNQMQELKNIKEKLKHTEADRMCQDETIKQLKDTIKSLNFVKDQLNDRICHLEPFESQIMQLSQDRSRLTACNVDLKKTADDCELLVGTLRQKESELLEFIQSLSNKNAQLQTEKQELSKEFERTQQQISKFEQKYKEAYVKINFWEEKAKSESKQASEEKEKLLKELHILKNDLIVSNQKCVDFEDQIYSLHKRHKAHIKDLTRQLTRPISLDPSKLPIHQERFKGDLKNEVVKSSSYSTSDESQTSTANHNDIEDLFDQESSKCTPDKVILHKARDKLEIKNYIPSVCQTPEIQMIEPHNQVLIEKIVKLQRLNAKLQDKVDFLNEHISHLTQEIQKKSFLLKYLFSQIEEKGSVKSDTFDENHFMMSKKSGIMASVFSSRSVDESMTLELSLEISRRLQSVLEDTTIKNITLKESINTLGEEISKLNEENRCLKKQIESS